MQTRKTLSETTIADIQKFTGQQIVAYDQDGVILGCLMADTFQSDGVAWNLLVPCNAMTPNRVHFKAEYSAILPAVAALLTDCHPATLRFDD